MAVLFAVLLTLPESRASQNWEERTDPSDAVRVWRKESAENPSLVAFRGETVMGSSIGRIASVLSDATRRTEWVADAKDVKLLTTYSPTDRVEYIHSGTPWPLQDRDFVYRAKIEVDQKAKTMTIHMYSVIDESMPKLSGIVRGEINSSRYVLTQKSPTETHVRVEIEADPKGAIPLWVVNLVQKNWPTKTLDGIREQALKKDIAEISAIDDFFAGKLTYAELEAKVEAFNLAHTPAPEKSDEIQASQSALKRQSTPVRTGTKVR